MPEYKNNIEDFVKPEIFNWDETAIKIPAPWNVNDFPQGGQTTMEMNNKLVEGGDFLTFPSYPKKWEQANIGWKYD